MNDNFNEITTSDILGTLSHTIKYDDTNKLITLFGLLSAYTDEDQFNICFNAPSSTGKTFIAMEVAKLFPKEDVIILGGCSNRALFHEHGKFDQQSNTNLIDFSRKILIFMDQPDFNLLSTLRPMLSHDQKEIVHKITDKSKGGGGNKTKTIVLKGYPSVIFCSASFKIDEQEGTRFIMLSPEVSTEKIGNTIKVKVEKDSDKESYVASIESKKDRNAFMQRIIAIKNAKIKNIIIEDPSQVLDGFMKTTGVLVPRHQRDIGRLTSIIKMFALINYWHREKRGDVIIANENDIQSGLSLWGKVSKSQYLGVPPYIIKFFSAVIWPLFVDKNKNKLEAGLDPDACEGLTRNEISQAHLTAMGSVLPLWRLNQEYLPPLEAANLIACRKHIDDGRSSLIYPIKYID